MAIRVQNSFHVLIVFQSIHQVPKKTAKAKPELIDVDLVRGT